MIWIEFLAAAVLWVVLVTALVSRWRRRWARVLLVVLAAVLPLAPVIFLDILAGIGLAVGAFWIGWFIYGTAWILVFAAGAVAVARKGLRHGEGAELPRAALWPRGKLGLAWAAASLLALMTFWNMDLAAQNQLAILQTEAGAKALSVAPARVPDSQNAAPLYTEAFAAMGDIYKWPEKWQDAARGKKVDSFDPLDPKLAEALKGRNRRWNSCVARPPCPAATSSTITAGRAPTLPCRMPAELDIGRTPVPCSR